MQDDPIVGIPYVGIPYVGTPCGNRSKYCVLELNVTNYLENKFVSEYKVY